MSSILKNSRTRVRLFLSTFSSFLILTSGALAVGMLFWANVYASHTVSLQRLAEAVSAQVSYGFDLNEALIGPHFVSLGLILAVLIPILTAMVVERAKQMPVILQNFLAVFLLVILILLPSSLGFLALQLLKGALDSGMLLGAYLGLFAVIVVFASLSAVITSGIRNQWLGLCASLILCVSLWLFGFPAEIVRETSRGVIDLRPLGGERITLAETKPVFVSEHTEKILRQFGKEQIVISVFLKTSDAERKKAETLLHEYAKLHPNLKYHLYDPDRESRVALKHQIDAYGSTVIEARGEKVIVSFPDEDNITSALAGFLTKAPKKRVIFVMGHNQPGLKDSAANGYENVAVKIKNLGYEIEESGLRTIPNLAKSDLILLAGARADLDDSEIEVLRRHFESGGSIFIAIDPVFPKEGDRVRQFLWELGVDFGRDVMIDKYSALQGVERLVQVVTDFGNHESVEGFSKPVVMPVARSVRKRLNVPSGLQITEIARTGKGSWAETNLADLENDKAELNENEDVAGPVSVVSALWSEKSNGRMIVAGDSEWLDNARFDMLGNREFLALLLKWLFVEPVMVQPAAQREIESPKEPFILLGREHAILFSASVLLTPIFLLVAGIVTFISNRK